MSRLKKFLRVLVTGSFTMLLSACYGVMIPFSATLRVKNEDGTSEIPELKISYKNYPEDEIWMDAGTTDYNGEFQFSTMNYSNEEYAFKIEDVDFGENLGDFQTKVVSLEDNLDDIRLIEKIE